MKCPNCNGSGISNTYVNGHFKNCEYCNGTGEIFQCPKCGEITHMNNIGSLFDHDYAWYRIECPQCGYCSDGGTDPQKAIDIFVKGLGNVPKPMTEKEWIQSTSTERLAEFLIASIKKCKSCASGIGADEVADCPFGECGCHFKDEVIKWLKQPHTNE